MPKEIKNMDNKYDTQLIIMQSPIESNKKEMKSNKQNSDDKMMNPTEDFKAIFTVITDQINTLKSSPTQRDSTKSLESTTVVLYNRRDTPFDSGQSTKIGGM